MPKEKKIIAVVTAYQEKFDDFVRENFDKSIEYICIKKLSDCVGRTFSEVVYLHKWQDLENYLNLEKMVQSCLR